MLQNTLYHIIFKQDTKAGQTLVNISLEPNSFIFKAHFPGFPIVPGACMVHISKELIEEKLKQNIQITHIKNLKFLKVIHPDEFPEIDLLFSLQKKEEYYSASVSYSKEEYLFCKFDYLFKIV
jgi:3-hydroxyacyl-[acyl-carrier-protein] dehydratase